MRWQQWRHTLFHCLLLAMVVIHPLSHYSCVPPCSLLPTPLILDHKSTYSLSESTPRDLPPGHEVTAVTPYTFPLPPLGSGSDSAVKPPFLLIDWILRLKSRKKITLSLDYKKLKLQFAITIISLLVSTSYETWIADPLSLFRKIKFACLNHSKSLDTFKISIPHFYDFNNGPLAFLVFKI